MYKKKVYILVVFQYLYMIKNSIQICLAFINTIIMYYNFNQNSLHCSILVLNKYILMKGFRGGLHSYYREFTCKYTSVYSTHNDNPPNNCIKGINYTSLNKY